MLSFYCQTVHGENPAPTGNFQTTLDVEFPSPFGNHMFVGNSGLSVFFFVWFSGGLQGLQIIETIIKSKNHLKKKVSPIKSLQTQRQDRIQLFFKKTLPPTSSTVRSSSWAQNIREKPPRCQSLLHKEPQVQILHQPPFFIFLRHVKFEGDSNFDNFHTQWGDGERDVFQYPQDGHNLEGPGGKLVVTPENSWLKKSSAFVPIRRVPP